MVNISFATDRAFAIAPNPNTGLFDMKLTVEEEGDCQLLVHDPLGKLIVDQSLEIKVGINTHGVDISNYPSGVYIVSLKSKDGLKQYTKRVGKVKY